jgi:hypothetical protein
MERPRTLEGARAMALAAMAQVPRNRDDSIHFTELHEVLSMGCVEFILASTCGQEPTEKASGHDAAPGVAGRPGGRRH